jgi:hypothetical protein
VHADFAGGKAWADGQFFIGYKVIPKAELEEDDAKAAAGK